MRACAKKTGGDADTWGITGLVHDFDYERFPNNEHRPDTEHPAEGVKHLRSLGYPEEVCQAILGHARYTNVPRVTPLAKTLFAVDELCGLVTATALVRPSKSVHEVDVRSVQKKFKDKAFARGVSREDIVDGVAELGVPLDEHIGVVIGALQGIAGELGLAGPGAA